MASSVQETVIIKPMHPFWDVLDIVDLVFDNLPDRDPALKSMMRVRQAFWELAVKRLWKKVDFHDLCLVFGSIKRNKLAQCGMCKVASRPHTVISDEIADQDWQRLALYAPFIHTLTIRITVCLEFHALLHRFRDAARPALPWTNLASLAITMDCDPVLYGEFPLAAFVASQLQQIALTWNITEHTPEEYARGNLLASFLHCVKSQTTTLRYLTLHAYYDDLLERRPEAAAALHKLLTTSGTSLRHLEVRTDATDSSFIQIIEDISRLPNLRSTYISTLRVQGLQLPSDAFPATRAMRFEGSMEKLHKMLESVNPGSLQGLQLSPPPIGMARSHEPTIQHAVENDQATPAFSENSPLSYIFTHVGRHKSLKHLRMDLPDQFGWGKVATALHDLRALERLWITSLDQRIQPMTFIDFHQILISSPALAELVLLGPTSEHGGIRPVHASILLGALRTLGDTCPLLKTLVMYVDASQGVSLEEAIMPFPKLSKAILLSPNYAYGSEEVRNIGTFLKRLMPELKFLGGLASSQQSARVAFRMGVASDSRYVEHLKHAAEFNVLS